MSEVKMEINCVESMYDDFFKELDKTYLRPVWQDIQQARCLDKVTDMTELREILGDSYRRLEHAFDFVCNMIAIDQMVNKKEDEA